MVGYDQYKTTAYRQHKSRLRRFQFTKRLLKLVHFRSSCSTQKRRAFSDSADSVTACYVIVKMLTNRHQVLMTAAASQCNKYFTSNMVCAIYFHIININLNSYFDSTNIMVKFTLTRKRACQN